MGKGTVARQSTEEKPKAQSSIEHIELVQSAIMRMCAAISHDLECLRYLNGKQEKAIRTLKRTTGAA